MTQTQKQAQLINSGNLYSSFVLVGWQLPHIVQAYWSVMFMLMSDLNLACPKPIVPLIPLKLPLSLQYSFYNKTGFSSKMDACISLGRGMRATRKIYLFIVDIDWWSY